MSREAFTRDELISALGVIQRILHAFPAGEYQAEEGATPTESAPYVPPARNTLPRDGGSPGDPPTYPADGSAIQYGYRKGESQPPRKAYAIPAKIKLDRVEWKGLHRAAQRIAQHLDAAHAPLTSHEIIAQLGMARPTFNNAISKLRQHKIVMVVPASRDSSVRR